jgi:hypothetical protein
MGLLINCYQEMLNTTISFFCLLMNLVVTSTAICGCTINVCKLLLLFVCDRNRNFEKMASKGKGVHVGSTSSGTQKQGRLNERGLILHKSEKVRYSMLVKRDVVPNRYPDSAALQALGIEDNVTTLISNVGWKDFVGETHFAFETSTLEFLSTISFVHDADNYKNPNHTVSFSLGNVEYNMSLTQFNDIMGFDSTGIIHDKKHRHFDKQEFWFKITGRNRFNSKTAKASMIQNPVFKYLHRVMACTIFGRPETATVRSDELFLLWAMINKCPVNTGYYLLDHLAYVAAQPKGKIVAGGLVSFIAWKLGARTATQEIGIDGNYAIDIDFCKNIHMVRDLDGDNKTFILQVFNEDSILLPDPSRTDVTNPANWLYMDLDSRVPKEQAGRDEEMGDYREEQQPATGMKDDDDDWRRRMEAKADRTYDEVACIKRMLAETMQRLNFHYPPPGPE